jgi:hypothetical protein
MIRPRRPIPPNPNYPEFHALYEAITDELYLFITEAEASGNANPDETTWFTLLIEGFADEFAGWATSPQPAIRNYLRLFGSSSRLVKVAAHAFLHVAYDLPRVLATNMNHPNTDKVRLRNLFLRPAPRLRQAFRDHLRAGRLGWVLKPLGRFEAVDVLAYWIIALRSVAWIHAEILADAPAQRGHWEANLARALYDAGEETRSRWWILGVPRLEISRLFQISPVSIVPRGFAGAALTFAGLVLGATVVGRNLAARVAFFGELVHLETTKALLRDRKSS